MAKTLTLKQETEALLLKVTELIKQLMMREKNLWSWTNSEGTSLA